MPTHTKEAYDLLSSLIANATPRSEWSREVRALWKDMEFIDRLELYEVLDTEHQDNPNILLRLADYYLRNGNYNQAEKTYGRLQKLQPKHSRSYLNLATCSLINNNPKQFEKILKKFLLKSSQKKTVILTLAKLIVTVPDSSLAYEKLIELIKKHDIKFSSVNKNYLFKKFQYLVTLNQPERNSKRGLINNNIDEEISCSPKGRSGNTVVILMDNKTHLGMIPIEVFDRYLASQDCTLITCFDRQWLGGMNGYQQHADNLEDSIEYLRNLCDKAHTKKLSFISNSNRSYGAIHHGLALKADNIVCFSGITDISYENLKKKNITYPKIVERMNNAFISQQLDLSITVSQHDHKPQIQWIYGNNCYIDSHQAIKMKKIKNIQHTPIEQATQHNSLFHSSLEKTLLDVLNLMS